jgi:hypothetical protein
MATAWLEPISSVIRVGADGAKHYDQYHFAATVRYLSIDEVEIVGVAKPKGQEQPGFTKADWVAIVECFRVHGVKRILFRRFKNGVARDKWVTVSR